jgi:hypothetical protein
MWIQYGPPRPDSGPSVLSLLQGYINVTMAHAYNVVTSCYHVVTISAYFLPHAVLTIVGMLAVDEWRPSGAGAWLVVCGHNMFGARRPDSGPSVISLLQGYINVTMAHAYNVTTSCYHVVTISAYLPPHPVLTIVGMLAVDEW